MRMVRRAALLAVLVLLTGVPVAFGSASWSTVMHRAVPAGVPARAPGPERSVLAHVAAGCGSHTTIYVSGGWQWAHGYMSCDAGYTVEAEVCLQTNFGRGFQTALNTCRYGWNVEGRIDLRSLRAGSRRGLVRRAWAWFCYDRRSGGPCWTQVSGVQRW